MAWLRGLGMTGAIPNFTDHVDTTASDTLTYSEMGFSASWHAWWGQGDCASRLCQSCLPECSPWNPVEQSCALLFYKNPFKDNVRNIPMDYYSYGWNYLASDECPFLYWISIGWEEGITGRNEFTRLKAHYVSFYSLSLSSEICLIETTDIQ